MEKFCRHIEKVLAQHDYVVVPGLGGFVVQRKSAQIFVNRITPPLSTIAFNPLMHHADGILAIEIARSQQISYRLAVEYIDKEIESIKFRLKNSGKVKLGNLGVLIQDELGNLLFNPSDSIDFLPDNLGLTDLHISARQFETKHENKKITIQFPATRIYKYAAAAAIFFGLFLTANKVSDVKQTAYADLASISFTKPIETIQKSVLDTTSTELTDLNDSILAEVQPEKSQKEEKIIIDEYKFHVVVASLANLSSAELYCKSLHDNNFSQAKVLTPGKNFRVAIQSFSNKEVALEFMESLRETDSRFETAWVYCE